jgi:hypothetical protein
MRQVVANLNDLNFCVSVVSRSTPRSVPKKKQKVEAKPKAESVSPPKPILSQEKKTPLIPAQAPRLFSQASKTANSTENGAKSTAAFGKDQIGDIEKVDCLKHRFIADKNMVLFLSLSMQ